MAWVWISVPRCTRLYGVEQVTVLGMSAGSARGYEGDGFELLKGRRYWPFEGKPLDLSMSLLMETLSG